MALKIPGSDRILNYWDYVGGEPPEGFDPNDPTIINADWIMKMMDKIVNGNYATKSFNVVQSVAELPVNAEQGQTAYVIEADYKDSFFIYDGTTWFNPITTKQDTLPTLESGKFLSNDGTNLQWSYLKWGTIEGNFYNQKDLLNVLLKGISNNNPIAEEIGGYPKNALVRFYEGKISYLVSSLVDNNMDEPNRENIQYRDNETGKKWRCIERAVVKAYKNGSDWYRLYTDGWCEQGGTFDNGSAARSVSTTITFLNEFEDANYYIGFTPVRNSTDPVVGTVGAKNKTAQNIELVYYGNSDSNLARYLVWESKGYVKNATLTPILVITDITNPTNSSTIVEQIGSDITVNANDTLDIEIAGAGVNGYIDDNQYWGSNGGIIRCVHTFTDATTLRLKKIRGRYSNRQLALAIFSYENNTETPILVAGSTGIISSVITLSRVYGGSGYAGATGVGASNIYKGYSYDGSQGNIATENTPDGSGDWAGSGNRVAYGGTGYVASFLEDDTTAITGGESQGNSTYAYAKIYKIED